MPLLKKIAALFTSMRPYNSIHPILLLYFGVLISHASLAQFWLTVAIIFIIHGGITIFNDLSDPEIDKANHLPVPINRGELSTRLARVAAYICVIVPLMASFILLPILVAIAFVVLVIIGWMYNSKPFQLSHRPIASIVALGISYGFIPFSIGLLLGATPSLALIGLGVALAIGQASLSMLKDYKDAFGDAKFGKKTFLLVFGRTKVRSVSMILGGIGYAIALFIAVMYTKTYLLLLPGVAFLILLIYERGELTPHKSYEQLNQHSLTCLNIQFIFDGLLIVCFII